MDPLVRARRTLGQAAGFRADFEADILGSGAHPVAGHPVADYFMVGVPFAKAVNPISKTNWEGTGVEPDVKVSAADALTTAEKLAIEKVQKDGQEQR